VYNLTFFLQYGNDNNLMAEEKTVNQKINNHKYIHWQQGVPEAYIYYYLMRQKGVRVY
jgi:hypothetical protein